MDENDEIQFQSDGSDLINDLLKLSPRAIYINNNKNNPSKSKKSIIKEKNKVDENEVKYIDEDDIEDNNYLKIVNDINDSEETSEDIQINTLINKYSQIVNKIFLSEIQIIFKAIYLYISTKKKLEYNSTKIASIFRGFVIRKNYKLNFLIKKILDIRINKAYIIKKYINGYYIRQEVKKIINKKKK